LKGKKLTLWPLPGGRENYFKTVIEFLEFISKERKTIDEAKQWFKDRFSSVNGLYESGGYFNVIYKQIGLVTKDRKNIIILTEEGEEILKTKDKERLYEIIDSRIVGFSNIIKILNRTTLSKQEIFPILQKEINSKWKKNNQLGNRLSWLISLNKIKINGRRYTSLPVKHKSLK